MNGGDQIKVIRNFMDIY